VGSGRICQPADRDQVTDAAGHEVGGHLDLAGERKIADRHRLIEERQIFLGEVRQHVLCAGHFRRDDQGRGHVEADRPAEERRGDLSRADAAEANDISPLRFLRRRRETHEQQRRRGACSE
jgi:hypothetical protein